MDPIVDRLRQMTFTVLQKVLSDRGVNFTAERTPNGMNSICIGVHDAQLDAVITALLTAAENLPFVRG